MVAQKKKRMVPRLRFNEFGGEWSNKEFGKMVSRSKSKFNSANETEVLPCVELECLSQETGILLKTFDSNEQKSIKNRFDKGDILFGKLRPYLKKFLKAPFEGVCSSEIWVLKGIQLDNSYLYQLIQTHKFNLEVNITSGSKMPRAEWEYISSVRFKFPQLPEQQKIASFLTAVDKKLQQLTTKKQQLEHYKKGVMQQLFSQQLRFKDDHGNDFPDWEEKRLADIGKIITGKTPSTSDDKLWNGEVQFITPTDINDNAKYQTGTTRTVVMSKKLNILPPNSIVYTCIASIGKMCLTTKPSITNQQINSVIPNSYTDNEYVYYYLLFMTPKIKSTQANTTLPIINKTDFSKFKIKVASLKEQQKIAAYLSALDAKIETVAGQLVKTQEFKKGLLQRLFV